MIGRKKTHGLSSYGNYLPQRLLLRQTFTRGTTKRLGVCTKGLHCMVQGGIWFILERGGVGLFSDVPQKLPCMPVIVEERDPYDVTWPSGWRPDVTSLFGNQSCVVACPGVGFERICALPVTVRPQRIPPVRRSQLAGYQFLYPCRGLPGSGSPIYPTQ
jgi:hypothetical protein